MTPLLQQRIQPRHSLLIEHPVFNFVWFYCLWFVCVLGGNSLLWLAIALLLFHFLLSSDRSNDIRLSVILGFIGVCVDSVLSFSGVFEFTNDVLIPSWLVVLWLGFPLTLRRGLKFLYRFPRLCFLAGSFGGATSYWSGFALGRVDFKYGAELSLLILILTWALLFPALMYLARRISVVTHSTQ